MNKFTKANGKKMLKSCNPFLDTFRTISRTGTKVQTTTTIINALIVMIEQRITAHQTYLHNVINDRACIFC